MVEFFHLRLSFVENVLADLLCFCDMDSVKAKLPSLPIQHGQELFLIANYVRLNVQLSFFP
jgi:hypothetical protein